MDKVFAYQGTCIHYSIQGKGPAVVLIHGFGEDGEIWKEQVEVLKEKYKIIIPDLPGSGQSEYYEKPLINISDYADIIYELLQNEAITSCVMLGHSMGGYITLAFANKYKHHLKGFGLVHSTAFADSEEKKTNRQKGISFINKHGAYAFLKTSIPGLFGNEFKKKNPQAIEYLVEKSHQFSDQALTQYYEAMIRRPARTDTLKGSEVPVLFVLGTEDTTVAMDDVLKQVHMPSIVDVHILEGAAHMGMLEKTGELNIIIKAFLKNVYQDL